MAEIATYPVIRHLRAEPTAHVLHYRRGASPRDGAGSRSGSRRSARQSSRCRSTTASCRSSSPGAAPTFRT